MRIFTDSKDLLVFIIISLLSLSRLTKTQTAPEIFYPFGSVAGDTINIAIEDENSTFVGLFSPFTFFGCTYNQIYINNNGHLTFNQPYSEYVPDPIPSNRSEDIIAPLWADIDVSQNGVISYQQYTSGSVLTRATQDINQHLPKVAFTATWVLVATWDRVAYDYHSGTETSFQVVLISGGNFSFILMNYGDIHAATGNVQVKAGYDTINSTHYFVIPGSDDRNYISNLKNTSNVNVPGRWAFMVNGEQNQSEDNIIGVEVRLTSFSDLTVNENIQIVLEKLKQELISRGLSNTIEMKLRRVQKIKP